MGAVGLRDNLLEALGVSVVVNNQPRTEALQIDVGAVGLLWKRVLLWCSYT